MLGSAKFCLRPNCPDYANMNLPAPRLTVPQVADLWSCTPQHVYRLISRGELGHVRIGTLIRVRVEDIECYEAAQCTGPQQAPIAFSEQVSGAKLQSSRDLREAFRRAQQTSAKRQRP
jgi:excisionase family DNA binding protein